MPSKTYPYQNKSLINLKGEKWKAIDGFEDYYMASNLGRLKSLDREIPHPRLKSQFVKGQILSQSVARNRNIITGEPSIDLRISLAREHIKYYFNTRRIIYSTFIKRINYQKDGLYVVNKDGNGFDCSVKNLGLVTKSEKQIRAIARGRVDLNFLKTIDRSKWKKNYSTGKPIDQFDLKGKLVKNYRSIREASRKTGFGQKEIINVAKGRFTHYKGFRWRYSKK